ncbi:unnamed protein product, partial [Didymodactylos carnosus]
FIHQVPDPDQSSTTLTIPIGSPLPHVQFLLLREQMEQVTTIDQPREMYMSAGSEQLRALCNVLAFKGYLNEPESTAKVLIDNPYYGGKMCKAGDLAKWTPNGELVYIT